VRTKLGRPGGQLSAFFKVMSPEGMSGKARPGKITTHFPSTLEGWFPLREDGKLRNLESPLLLSVLAFSKKED
jgi:hypothetical protein